MGPPARPRVVSSLTVLLILVPLVFAPVATAGKNSRLAREVSRSRMCLDNQRVYAFHLVDDSLPSHLKASLLGKHQTEEEI
ncbi:hypothetical protein PR202_gb08944 [Eleusine coracana subsp. coracana]|uniref:Uncharacterized protein n=1 Tax=Eleusine coracana subsp. coracana TaxID=191504 RepID=A0AAV5EH21_ELECO|nr:hypothetical protein PR202_gb08944 [Eleusine coracana subsp. coracana]